MRAPGGIADDLGGGIDASCLGGLAGARGKVEIGIADPQTVADRLRNRGGGEKAGCNHGCSDRGCNDRGAVKIVMSRSSIRHRQIVQGDDLALPGSSRQQHEVEPLFDR